jgi:hypothetical protein
MIKEEEEEDEEEEDEEGVKGEEITWVGEEINGEAGEEEEEAEIELEVY